MSRSHSLFTTPPPHGALAAQPPPLSHTVGVLLSAVANLRAQGEEEAARELVGRLLFFGVLFGFFLIPILQVRGQVARQRCSQAGWLAAGWRDRRRVMVFTVKPA